MQRLADKTILITGGAGGLGSAAVALFIEQGARVVISDLNVDAGKALAARYGKQAAFIEHDVTNEAAWAQTMAFVAQQFGRLDVLINNAGILQSGNIETATLAQWRQQSGRRFADAHGGTALPQKRLCHSRQLAAPGWHLHAHDAGQCARYHARANFV